jgi:hypothetical protein
MANRPENAAIVDQAVKNHSPNPRNPREKRLLSRPIRVATKKESPPHAPHQSPLKTKENPNESIHIAVISQQYLETAPAPKPVLPVDRVEPDVATNAPAATNEAATYAKPVATNSDKPVRTANRREPEAYRAYQRTYMAKRRAAEKVTGPEDRASLAIADSPA